MVDFDLAMLYGVQNKRLNEQVKRNIERFPDDFMFQLTKEEWNILRSQIATAKTLEDKAITLLRSQIATAKDLSKIRTLPYAFTRNGIGMLSSVLGSKTAVAMNIRIMRAFIQGDGSFVIPTSSDVTKEPSPCYTLRSSWIFFHCKASMVRSSLCSVSPVKSATACVISPPSPVSCRTYCGRHLPPRPDRRYRGRVCCPGPDWSLAP